MTDRFANFGHDSIKTRAISGESATGPNALSVVVESSTTGQGSTTNPTVVTGNSAIIPIVFSLDTSALGDGDVAADTQVVTDAMRVNDGTGVLLSVVLNSKDDVAANLDLVLFSSNVSLGTENAAPSITDANADNILGIVSLLSTDWIDLGGNRTLTKTNIGLLVVAASGTKNLYAALVVKGSTPTFTAAGITARLGFLRD